ncbi:hypothetical protein KIH31_15575 [Paenarthrobacter sp. DKR-5]|uniref:hypothetical protein n=1 Tax=Paenarthrobacter sp. DKR-5 TaxID=2835535 RepID=UPI001BDD0B18|nr:hypothetical protein [Paenarthrobacter sp. DKR-5]MBT1004008.1 hypothetical protein [Paenarthrobacter sp. DKR-5]
MDLRRTAFPSLALIGALMLGAGAGTPGSLRGPGAAAAPAGSTASPSGAARPAAGPAGDLDLPTGYPHESHTDERRVEEELELTEAAPPTLGRFSAGVL